MLTVCSKCLLRNRGNALDSIMYSYYRVHIDSVSPKSKMLIDASAIIESLKEIKLGKSDKIYNILFSLLTKA